MLYKEVKKKDGAVENLVIDSTRSMENESLISRILVEKLILSQLGTISWYVKVPHYFSIFSSYAITENLSHVLLSSLCTINIFVIRELRAFSEIPDRISNISQTFSAS